jgi:transcriptional regulator with XRE-family HTH domain
MRFGEILKHLRTKAGLSQQQLADASGVPVRSIQNWEQGERTPVSPAFFNLLTPLNAEAMDFWAVVEEKPKRKAVTK